MNHLNTVLLAAIIAIPLSQPAFGAEAGPRFHAAWIRQFGTASPDSASSVAIDGAGRVNVVGSTFGNFTQPNAGYFDVVFAQFEASGELIQSQQFGTPGYDFGFAVAVDEAQAVVLSGYTTGDLVRPSLGSSDAYLIKRDASGNDLWSRQFGTAEADAGNFLEIDNVGNVYVSGFTYGHLASPNAGKADAFVTKFDPSGVPQWSRQLGTNETETAAVAVDVLGNVYLNGYTEGSLAASNAGAADIFVTKYDASGRLLWSRQFGTTESDYSFGIAVGQDGSAYLCGRTQGNLGATNLGMSDAFVAKYDANGTLAWIQQFGTNDYDFANAISLDQAGNVLVCGTTFGDLAGVHQGGADIFVAKLSSTGRLVSLGQIGTPADDEGHGIAFGPDNDVYVAGRTMGGLGDVSMGDWDGVVVKFSLVPEPQGIPPLALSSLVFSMVSRKRRAPLACRQ